MKIVILKKNGHTVLQIAKKCRVSPALVKMVVRTGAENFYRDREKKLSGSAVKKQVIAVVRKLQDKGLSVTANSILLRWKSPLASSVSIWTMRRLLKDIGMQKSRKSRRKIS